MQTYSTSTGNGPATAGGSSTDQAKEKAQQAAGQAKDALRSQVDRRSTDLGERVESFAWDARGIGDHLRQQGKDQEARLADQAAERAKRLADYLKRSDADGLLQDVEDFGRRQPWAVIAGGLVLGVIASRFLKASSSSRYEQRRSAGDLTPRAQAAPATSGPPRYVPAYEGDR